MEETKKNLLTREGLKKYEDELHELKINRRKEVSEKLKEARAQGDLSENAEYDAAKDEQRDIEARIFELEQLLKNVEVVDDDEDGDGKKIAFGMQVVIKDLETKEEFTYVIKGASEADSLNGSISNESPLGKALIGAKKGQTIEVECPVGTLKYKVVSFTREIKEAK